MAKFLISISLIFFLPSVVLTFNGRRNHEDPFDFEKKPYSMTPTENSVRIMWQTAKGFDGKCILEIGISPDKLDRKFTVDKSDPIEGEGNIYKIEVSDLKPFATYYYRVGDGRRFSDILETKTAPKKGQGFRIMAMSDIHQNNGRVWEKIAKRAVQDSLDMFVLIGDLVNRGNEREAWDKGFFEPGRPLLGEVPFIGSIGNHETAFGPTTYYDYFSFPEHSLKDDHPSSYFYFDYGDVRMIAINLNGNKFSPDFSKGSPQYAWLEQTIEEAKSKWIFIFSHVNVISTGTHAQWSANQKKYIKPLLEKYAANKGKNIIMFSGDDHNFEHLYTNGVNYFKPGVGNSSIRGQFNMIDAPYSVYFRKVTGYSIIDVNPDGSVIVTAKNELGEPFYQVVFDEDINNKREQERPTKIKIFNH